ncbi:hypothetical protein [Formosa sp. A9]|uniref:hypothetical protein n=1 Tax=Formosa sp. A9 TaxID=3442641 RepID=UPI003EBC1AD3
MAKVNSLIKIEGTLDGLTFYKGKDGYLVRTKGGVSKNRIENDPAFARTRENGLEFGHCATMGKWLRQALTTLVSDAKDRSMVSRLSQTLSKVKNTDLTSARGYRLVPIGLESDEGKALLKAFDFNSNAILTSVLLQDLALNTTTGEISIDNLVPSQHISVPSGATHVSFTAAVLNLNLNTNEKDLQVSPIVNIPINNTVTSVNTIPAAMPTGDGNVFYLFKISFFQEINTVQYPLNNGAFNVLHIVEIL